MLTKQVTLAVLLPGYKRIYTGINTDDCNSLVAHALGQKRNPKKCLFLTTSKRHESSRP